MEQAPLIPNKQSENKKTINIPSNPSVSSVPSAPPVSPAPSVPPVSPPAPPVFSIPPVTFVPPAPSVPPVSSGVSAASPAQSVPKDSPAKDIISKPPVNVNMQGNGQKTKLIPLETQGIKPSLMDVKGSKSIMIAAALILIAVLGIGGYYFYSKGNTPQPEGSPAATPAKKAPVADKNLDSDKDGLPDAIEKVLDTYMTKADTDGDGYTDLQEIKSGYNPLVAGGAGKYSSEEWDLVKGRIKIEDRDFYEREFGTPAVSSPSPSLIPTPTPEISLTPTPVISPVPSPI